MSHSEVRRLVKDSAFTAIDEGPFLVVGDESPATVTRRARGTVRWARNHLRASFFDKDPEGITIWLFRDERSYRTHTKALFGDEPSTPFGYYSPSDAALIMNISTGGGTLVHEMVHPYVAVNFPDCPAWFNEGLGSLYEQSAERDGRIVGLTNWRLNGLQAALRAGPIPTFRALTATTTKQFYDEDPGTNYAQARYLLYYLQQKGKLREYYRAFHARHQRDPTGYATLMTVLGERDMRAFQEQWERWVMTLRFE